MRLLRLGAVGALALGIAAAPVSSARAQIVWTGWTAFTAGQTTGTATGTIGSTTVNYVGEVGAGSLVNTPVVNPPNTGLWRELSPPLAYGGIGPKTNDFIQLSGGTGTGTNTLSFSAPVDNVFLAIISLGQPGLPAQFNFDHAFTINSQGAGNFGGSATSLTATGNTLFGTEGNGVLQFTGPITSISWTNPVHEFYYGFTVGAAGGTSTIPEPSSLGLLASGLVGLAPIVRRRRR
jgi:hypothetical protein